MKVIAFEVIQKVLSVCLGDEDQAVLLQLPCSALAGPPLLPEFLGEKIWSPWQPQQARLSRNPQYPILKKYMS